ncbi:MAG: hypothetical protein FJ290_29930 [Planctomycetes bacterium]|nr:hypothetical protein [Planctomycetota bacterium]
MSVGIAMLSCACGVLAVGGARNGGQELTIQSIQAALLSHEALVVGTSRPTGRMGAALWNQGDDITKDEFGLSCAKDLIFAHISGPCSPRRRASQS